MVDMDHYNSGLNFDQSGIYFSCQSLSPSCQSCQRNKTYRFLCWSVPISRRNPDTDRTVPVQISINIQEIWPRRNRLHLFSLGSSANNLRKINDLFLMEQRSMVRMALIFKQYKTKRWVNAGRKYSSLCHLRPLSWEIALLSCHGKFVGDQDGDASLGHVSLPLELAYNKKKVL